MISIDTQLFDGLRTTQLPAAIAPAIGMIESMMGKFHVPMLKTVDDDDVGVGG